MIIFINKLNAYLKQTLDKIEDEFSYVVLLSNCWETTDRGMQTG